MYHLLTEKEAADLLGERPADSHKGDYGYVTLLGGSVRYSGAIKLANLSCNGLQVAASYMAGATKFDEDEASAIDGDMQPLAEATENAMAARLMNYTTAAMRAGAGVVKLTAPEQLTQAILPYILESTFFPMPSTEDGQLRFDAGKLDLALDRQRAVAFGMGVGTGEETAKILEYILQNKKLTLIIDADGLNELAAHENLKELLKTTECKVILTPHVKEFSRLTGESVENILKEPVWLAKEFAACYSVTVLLKGHVTTVTDGDRIYQIDRGCSGMATAGSGDVLSGVLCGMAGYIADPVESASAAAFIAGMAGEMAEQDKNPVSMTAGDTAEYVEKAITRLWNRYRR
ncbi:MAG: NAD(P)H-hydrate dehydratase [Lachnospiraceae bacterium]|nr:NAD(P)H-hydrate dehydratase [Lachnospiraceae bacterium]